MLYEKEDTQLSSFAERLRYARQIRRISQTELAEKIGADQSVVANIERRNSQKSKYVHKIADVLDIDLTWLITGEGTMGHLDIDAFLDSTSRPDLDLNIQKRKKWIPIFFYDIDIQYNTTTTGEKTMAFQFVKSKKNLHFEQSFFRERHLNAETCLLAEANGDYMKPYINHNDVVMFDKSDTTPVDNEVYLIIFEGERLIRRFEKHEGGIILLVADNTNYNPKQVTDINSPNFKILGRVVYRCG